MDIPGGTWKREGSEEAMKDTTMNREVGNTSHNVMVSLIIINFYIEFGTLANIIQHLIRLSDTSKATKERMEKISQHKLGPGGYSNLAAQFLSIENPIMHPNNK